MGLLCNFSKGLQSIHLIFLNICELSFNRDFAHCCRAFDMSNKYYLLTYLLTYLLICYATFWSPIRFQITAVENALC